MLEGGAGGRQGDGLSWSWVKAEAEQEMWGDGGQDGTAAAIIQGRGLGTR